jgi:hypothetical protein
MFDDEYPQEMYNGLKKIIKSFGASGAKGGMTKKLSKVCYMPSR